MKSKTRNLLGMMAIAATLAILPCTLSTHNMAAGPPGNEKVCNPQPAAPSHVLSIAEMAVDLLWVPAPDLLRAAAEGLLPTPLPAETGSRAPEQTRFDGFTGDPPGNSLERTAGVRLRT